MANAKFDRWIDDLRAVIQDDYGYEEGEFTVYPSEWHPLFKEGLTPPAAFRRALDAFAEERKEQGRLQAENWKRIQEEEDAAIAKWRASKGATPPTSAQ